MEEQADSEFIGDPREISQDIEACQPLRPLLDERLLAAGGHSLTDPEFGRMVAVGDLRRSMDAVDLDEAARVVLKQRAGGEAMRERRRERRTRPILSPDPRYRALAEILALEASQHPRLKEWRVQHLPQGLLEPQDVRGFIINRLVAERRASAAQRGGGPRKHAPQESELHYYGPQGEHEWRYVPPEGALGELQTLSAAFSRIYDWAPEDATTFILTGQVPEAAPVKVATVTDDQWSGCRVILEIDPRTPQQFVSRAYNAVRKEAFGEVRSARVLEERTACLAIFLSRHSKEPWSEIRRLWNKDYGERRQGRRKDTRWHYDSEQAFAKDATKAWEAVVGKPFKKPRAGEVA